MQTGGTAMYQIEARPLGHYDVAVAPQKAGFTLHRAGEDLAALTNRAYKLGVLGVIGFYQELNDLCAK
jgi:hypothetical protein